jgi:hypothetical protein
MQDIEWAAEGPGEDKLTVTTDSAVSCNIVQSFEYPLGDVFAVQRPKEAETDAVESFVYPHLAGGRGGVVSQENGATEGSGNNNQHE